MAHSNPNINWDTDERAIINEAIPVHAGEGITHTKTTNKSKIEINGEKPAHSPIFFNSHAIFFPRSSIVWRPSISLSTSPGLSPMPIFQ